MFSLSFRRLMLGAVIGLAAVPPVSAAVTLEPGLWQTTEAGTEDGKPAKPEDSTDCLSPEDAREPVKTILKDAEGEKCETLNAKENGNTISVEMKCGDPKEVRMEISMTITVLNPKHYNGTMKSLVIFRGQTTTSEKTIDAKWLAAACKK
jgi:hypothetical protein